ncbi:MAG: prepilin-type N-terminal cleavage/methylation domain-containing protein [Pseudomonadota bacterium]
MYDKTHGFQAAKEPKGFTLVELIIVITVLSILAMFAVPQWVSLQNHARAAVMEGIKTAMTASANFVYAKSLIEEQEFYSSGKVIVNGNAIDTVYGFPAEHEILGLIELVHEKFDITTNRGIVAYKGVSTPKLCQVDYNPPVRPGDQPTIHMSGALNCE